MAAYDVDCSPLLDLAVTTEPSPAVAGRPFTLRLDGMPEVCALVSVASAGGPSVVEFFTVSLDYDFGCTLSPPPPISLEIEVDGFPAGNHEVLVRLQDGHCPMRFEVDVAPAAAGAGVGPAATLLVPYFEADLEDPAGPTTLVAIGNALAEPVLAHAVMWTDTAIPTLAFDLYLPADGVQTVNLRDVFRGVLPATGGPDAPPGCSDPVELPVFDAAALRARHTGQADPVTGLCWGSDLKGASVATGYLTVDVVHDCAELPATPLDAGYFAAGGTGRAANRNALWGDYFYLAEGDDAAQGIAAVQIPASPAFAEWPTFYGIYTDGSDSSREGSSPFRRG